MALFLVLLVLNHSGAGINDVKQSLKKGKVKAEDIKINSTNIKIDPTQSKVKPNLKKIDLPPNYNGKKEDFFKKFYKPLTEIKIGGKKISVRPSSNKPTTKPNLKVSGPQRIQDTVKKTNKGEAVFAIPDPAQEFGFSETQEDKIRVQGEAEVIALYKKAKSIVWGSAENPKILKEMHDMTYDVIFTKYSRYPDLCAIARLYLIDATARFYLNPTYPLKEYSNGTFGGKDNNYYKRYLQIVNDYIHEKKDVNISKIFDIIAKQRMNIIWENDAGAATNITEDQSKIQTGLKNLNEIINESAYYPDSEKAYIGAVVDEMSLILSYYRDMYYWSIMTGDYQTAHSIFNYGLESGEIKFTGTFMDVYNSIPKQVIFHYVSGYDEQGDPVIKDKMVDLYKEAAQLLSMVELFRASETKVNEQEFDEKDKNLTQAKIEASCDWLNTFKPRPSDDETPPEVISATDLEIIHNNAYGENDYYKNKPVIIKRMYFTRDENIELTYEDIPSASDRITIRCEIDSTQPVGPSYDMKIVMHSNVSNKDKPLTMKQDYEFQGFYEKFRPNETNDEINNLIIKPDKSKESIAVLNGFRDDLNGKISPDGKFLYDSTYFDVKLLYSTFETTSVNMVQGIIPSTEGFCRSGGGEFLTATFDQDTTVKTTSVIIKNQAKWFVLEGHGDPVDGSFRYLVSTNNNAFLNLVDASKNLKDNIEILFINACDCLNYDQDSTKFLGGKWHKALPLALIAGYSGDTYSTATEGAFETLSVELNNAKIIGKTLTKHEIGQTWLNVNLNFYNKCMAQSSFWSSALGTDAAKNARYMLNEDNGTKYKYWFIGYGEKDGQSVLMPLFYEINEEL